MFRRLLSAVALLALIGCGPAATTAPPPKPVAVVSPPVVAPPAPVIPTPPPVVQAPPKPSPAPVVVQPPPPPPAPPVEELDPGNMHKGDTGTLPRTSNRLRYFVAEAVFDDDILIGVQQLLPYSTTTVMDRGDGHRTRVTQPSGDAWQIGERFFLKDPFFAAIHPSSLELPDVYTVIGTKTINGVTLPRLSVKTRHPVEGTPALENLKAEMEALDVKTRRPVAATPAPPVYPPAVGQWDNGGHPAWVDSIPVGVDPEKMKPRKADLEQSLGGAPVFFFTANPNRIHVNGPAWNKMNPAGQKQLVETYSTFLTAKGFGDVVEVRDRTAYMQMDRLIATYTAADGLAVK